MKALVERLEYETMWFKIETYSSHIKMTCQFIGYQRPVELVKEMDRIYDLVYLYRVLDDCWYESYTEFHIDGKNHTITIWIK